MKDIFGYKRSPKPEGVFSSEEALLTIGGSGGSVRGALVQGINTNYQQQVGELTELGSPAIYWVKGRPVGQGQLNRIVGAQAITQFFNKNMFDLCDGGGLMQVSAKTGGCGKFQNRLGRVTMSMDGAVVSSIGFSMQVSDSMLMEQAAFRFALMELQYGT